MVNKTAGTAAQLANDILLHAYSVFTYICSSQLCEHKQNFIKHI